MSKYPFPYDTFEAGMRDKWSKLQGHDIMSILGAGWYQVQNRKDRNLEQTAAFTLAKKNPEFKKLMDQAKAAIRKQA